MGKPGRKRSAKARHPGGRVKSERVGPTPELQARRAYLAGVDDNGKPRDPNKTSYPLGVLLVNDGIDQRQHDAGCRYAWLYQSVYGRVSITAANYDGAPRGAGEDLSDVEAARREREIRDAIAHLTSRGLRGVTDGLCLYGRVPRWMRPVAPTEHDVMAAKRLIAGLNALGDILTDVAA